MYMCSVRMSHHSSCKLLWTLCVISKSSFRDGFRRAVVCMLMRGPTRCLTVTSSQMVLGLALGGSQLCQLQPLEGAVPQMSDLPLKASLLSNSFLKYTAVFRSR